MQTKRWTLALVGALALSPVLAACGDGDEPDDARDPSSSEPVDRTSPTDGESTGSAETTSPPASETSEADTATACDILAPDDIATAYGVTPGSGEIGVGAYTEQGVAWESQNCDFEAEDFMEVELAVASEEDFQAGFTCPPQSDTFATVEKVKVAGADSASWKVSEGEPFEAELRVCTESVVFDLSLDFEDGYQHEGDPLAQTIGLAEVVLERIS